MAKIAVFFLLFAVCGIAMSARIVRDAPNPAPQKTFEEIIKEGVNTLQEYAKSNFGQFEESAKEFFKTNNTEFLAIQNKVKEASDAGLDGLSNIIESFKNINAEKKPGQ
ncbi:hypothetical protein KR018_000943 [Drosophila ironensis]|nr:hypothetical protein KR018_000943 [Drosophila ironensis]